MICVICSRPLISHQYINPDYVGCSHDSHIYTNYGTYSHKHIKNIQINVGSYKVYVRSNESFRLEIDGRVVLSSKYDDINELLISDILNSSPICYFIKKIEQLLYLHNLEDRIITFENFPNPKCLTC